MPPAEYEYQFPLSDGQPMVDPIPAADYETGPLTFPIHDEHAFDDQIPEPQITYDDKHFADSMMAGDAQAYNQYPEVPISYEDGAAFFENQGPESFRQDEDVAAFNVGKLPPRYLFLLGPYQNIPRKKKKKKSTLR
eukprot:Colp12_sorted_trinity150504_noHs@21214